MTGSTQMVFCPQISSLELLENTLTSDRRKLAENISNGIHGWIAGGPSNNTLIIGPRGAGKTHVLSYIHKNLEAGNHSIKIIRLSEEERCIASLFDFIVTCLRAAGIPPDELSNSLKNCDESFKAGKALEIFEKKFPGQALLIIENLGHIFADCTEQELRDLRGFFQNHPLISVLASSVTLFTDSSRADHPFHGFFLINYLKKLTCAGAKEYLTRLADSAGNKELAEYLKTDKEAHKRVKAIYNLTGGNHRLLAMLYGFLSPEDLAELVEPFMQLTDKELTPYYQQRLDRLSPQQNKLLRAIADQHGRALTVNEIAAYSFLSPQTVSRQLCDLRYTGLVRSTSLGRESYYELAEPLLRLVLDMKEGRDKPLPLIVAIIKTWYETEELKKQEKNVPEWVRGYYSAALDEKMRIEIAEKITSERRLLAKLLRKGINLEKEGKTDSAKAEFEKALAGYDKLINQFGTSDTPELQEQVAKAMVNKGVALGRLGRNEEAVAVYDKLIKRFSSNDQSKLQEQVAKAIFNKAVRLGRLGRSEEEIAVYDELIKQFGTSDTPELQEQVARAIAFKIPALKQLGRKEQAYAILIDHLNNIPPRTRAIAAEILLNSTIPDYNDFSHIVFAFQEHRKALAEGLTAWIKKQLPMSKAEAEKLAGVVENMEKAFKDIREAEMPLKMLKAVQGNALGDKKALFQLPLELRRLVTGEDENTDSNCNL